MDVSTTAVDPPRTLYLVQRLHWMYNDEYYEPQNDEPIRAFANRAAAEAYRRALEYIARGDEKEERDGEGHTLLPRDDPDLQFVFFQVVEVECANERSDSGGGDKSLYYVRLKQRYRWHAVLPTRRLTFISEAVFSSPDVAHDFQSTAVPPRETKVVPEDFVDDFANRLMIADGVTADWLCRFVTFVEASGLPPLPEDVRGISVRIPAEEHWIYPALESLYGWWRGNAWRMTRWQVEQVWRFVCGDPYEVFAVPLVDEADPARALAAVDELLRPLGRSASDYPPLPATMELRGYYEGIYDELPPVEDGYANGFPLTESTRDGSVRERYIRIWNPEADLLPAPGDSDAPPDK